MAYIEKRTSGYKARIYVKGEGKLWLPGTFPTEEEARVAAATALEEESTGRETVRAFAERWTTDYPRAKHSTQGNYESAAKRIAASSLGKTPLGKVTRPVARRFAQENMPLKQAVSAMFTDALNDGLVEVNPFHNLNLPVSRGRKDILPLTEEEVMNLADTAWSVWPREPGLTMAGLIIFQAFVGCRNGEAFAVRHADINYEWHEVHLRRRLYNGVEDTLKSGKSRKVVFPAVAHAAVRIVPRNPNNDRVFTAARGGPFNKSQFYHYWHPIRCAWEQTLDPRRREALADARGKEHLDFYELRHFCATYLLNKGLSPADVAYQLGHQDGGRLVVERYGHPDDALRRERIKAAF